MNFNVNDPVRRQLTSDNGSFQPKKRGVNLSIVRGVGNDKYQVLSRLWQGELGTDPGLFPLTASCHTSVSCDHLATVVHYYLVIVSFWLLCVFFNIKLTVCR